ncbi:hypothetical protein LOTGIDRAFT_120077 [Lottia gigantea]|uniref:C2H2-type domain-containing protein n=1 Tax=Lottia gigantea TaxID=225164 RepID=V4A7N4_LOTGI|nr:hypothetical protein LOTGIDRAFT_120077 [Lottia gigantea]ESO92757.1 hypothetical protein LOTGIDRAFT_120077 [Lottia gigantea]
MTSVTREECGIFECNHCHKFFTTDHSLQRHITKRHNQTVTSVKVVAPCYSDETSVFTYADEETLTLNYSKLHKCDICNKTFDNYATLEDHRTRKYSKKTPYKCHVCEKVFTQSSHFKSHAALHTGEAYTKCKICGKYLTAASMSKHINRHKGIIEKNYKCLICGKSFASNYYFKIHKRIHTGEKPFGCSVCKQRFIRKDSLKLHVYTTNLSKDTSYCDICGTTFNSSKSYKAHYRTTHLDEEQTDDYNDRKPFKCDLCDNKFISKGNLKYHLYSHLGREAFPYQCDVCFKKFSHQSNLRGHMRTHTNVRPFKCEVCEVSFKRGTHLRNHMRIHTGDFDTCPKCAKTFSHARYLKDHLKQVHSLILNKDSQLVKFTETTRLKKGFKCEICGKELTRKTRLNDHMRLHTGHKAFKCGNCDEGFISTYYLNNHYKQYPEHKQ